jgi:hypothetical protein
MREAMKKIVLAGIAALTLLAGISGCYYFPTGYNGSVRTRIGAKNVPANTVSIALIVTGPDMAPIQMVLPPDAPRIDLDVPAGPARTFTLLLTSPSATLSAETTVDLVAGGVREIFFTPKLGGTDIVIPDALNNRIVQISDMTGTGWIEKGSTGPSDFGGGSFMPYDVDFDDQGRIYIANSAGESSVGEIVRIDDINHVSATTCVKIEPGLGGGMNALAVDRINGYVYYITGYSPVLYRKNIRSATIASDSREVSDLSVEPEIGTSFNPTAIAVDAEGCIYFVINAGTNNVLKYDPRLPLGSRVVVTNSLESPWDIAIMNGKVLVSDPGTNSIAYSDLNLNYPSSFDYSPAPFVGPERFLGVADLSGIYVIDELYTVAVTDRLVYMDDISGVGWVFYGTTGSLINQFKFFN